MQHINKNKYELIPQQYQNSPNKQQYIYHKLIMTSNQLQINFDAINLEELHSILRIMKIVIFQRMLHQAYIYSSNAINQIVSLKNQKQKNRNIRLKTDMLPRSQQRENKRLQSLPNSIANNQKISLDPQRLAMWILKKLSCNQIYIKPNVNYLPRHSTTKSQHYIQKQQRIQDNQKTQFPPVYDHRPTFRYKSGINNLKKSFQKMKKQRQQNGIVPLDIQKTQNTEPVHQGYNMADYDPSLHDVNKKLENLKKKAERSLTQIIQASTYDSNLRSQLEDALVRHYESRAKDVQKIGRYGAMKAYRRLNQKRKLELQRIQKIRQNLNLTGDY